MGVLAVLLCRVPLVLYELELALPEGLFPIVGVQQVLVLPLKLRVLLPFLLQLLLREGLIAGECQLELLDRLVQ